MLPGLFLAAFAFITCALFVSSAQAQTLSIKPVQVRVTVPIGYSGSFLITNRFSFGTNGVTPDITGTFFPISDIDVSAAGVPSLPSGLTLYTTDPNSLPLSIIAGKTNTSGFSTNVFLWVNTTNVAQGFYTFTLNASGGATNSFIFILEVAHIWNGSTNAFRDGSGDWGTSGNWIGGVPGTGDDVVFSDLGGQSNTIIGGTNPIVVSSVLSSSLSLDSLRFSQTNTVNAFHVLQIASGQTLTITGTNSFSFYRDYIDSIATTMNVTIIGTNAAIVVTNNNANFALEIDDQEANTLDMSRVDNFKANVREFALGDYSVWPYVTNLWANNLSGPPPRKFVPTVDLAKTNVIKALFADPNNYTNSDNRNYALCQQNSLVSGSTSRGNLVMGISNEFFLDSMCIGHAAQQGNLLFNPALLITTNLVPNVSTNYVTNTMVAYFRNTNGGRMSMFAVADGGATNSNNGNPSSSKGSVTLTAGNTPGLVDMLVDRLYIARDRVKNPGAGGQQIGDLEFGAGVIDANEVILGYQEHPGQTNLQTYSQGTMTVSNTAVLIVHNDLQLGYTTETNLAQVTDSGFNFGKLNIGPGGTVMANIILVGGPKKLSTVNNIALNNGATLIVSNTMADTNMYISLLSFGASCTNVLFVDGNHTGYYEYATNLTTSVGSGPTEAVIDIGSIKNVGSSATIPLIYYSGGGTPSFQLVLPAGSPYSGAIQVLGNTNVALSLSLGTPKNLVWRGTTADWDYTTKNWLDKNTSLMTNFNDFDNVSFDDTPGYPTSINLATLNMLPGSMTMTNTALNYQIGNGSPGSLAGSSSLAKTGSGWLEFDGTGTIGLQISQGNCTNYGTVGSITISSGVIMANAGTINGGVVSSGTVFNGGPINGSMSVQSGGTVTNLNTINGALSFQSGALLYNAVSGTIDHFGSSTLVSNATLINDGTLGNGADESLSVNGTLVDNVGGSSSMEMTTLTINGGAGANNVGAGTFIPGGTGTGTTTVFGNHIGSFPGRVTFAQGSTNIFKVNTDNSQNTVLQSGYQDFGGSASQRSQNGGTIVMENLASSSTYAAGQTFTLFENSGNGGNINFTGSATNTYPVIIPSTPGPGLGWDMTHLWAPNAAGHNGIIGIVSASAGPTLTNASFSISGTNVLAEFTWPTNDLGWRLESQVSALTVGLQSYDSNWTGVNGSWTNTDMIVTNVLVSTNAVFFRLVFP
jgi:hypothetical protein